MNDLYYTPSAPEPAELTVWLPENVASEAINHEGIGTLYLCDGYTVSLQTLPAGDLDATLCTVTGYGESELRGIHTQQGEWARYACAWASAGEGGDQVGRTVVLDDGSYHYALTLCGPAAEAAAMADTWKTITDSVSLDTAASLPDTASGIAP